MVHCNTIAAAFLLLNLLCFIDSSPTKVATKEIICQKCDILAEDGRKNVHLVPHSHDEVGWLKTLNEYYSGTGKFKSYETAGVEYILNSTIKALKANPDRRYIQVETAFFWKWWNHQNETTKEEFISLVNSGQLEIVNGGWTMNDEATTNYQSIIDQFTWGFRILVNHLGQCGQPTVGWQIDPFGHSKEHAWLMKQFGFEGLVVGRIDQRDKEQRKKDKSLDFNWKTNGNVKNSTIFTTTLPNTYDYEADFCFDSTCNNKIVNITDENLADKVDQFASLLDEYRSYYKTSNILIPMGGDFAYQQAEASFLNLDKLIEGFKNHKTYNVFYSTPTCYIRAVKKEIAINTSLKLQTKTDDFFPYSSDIHSFWVGYFTSRPTLKRFEIIGHNILQSAKQLTTFSRITTNSSDNHLQRLRTAVAVLQHHQAITGTEKQVVANDYVRMLHEAIKQVEKPMGTIIGNLLRKDNSTNLDLKLSTCLLANISICTTTQKDKFLVVIQNPLSRNVTHYVRLPVDGDNYRITGPDGEEVADVFDTIHSFNFVKEDTSPASKELVFAARDLPPLGLKVYYVEKQTGDSTIYHQFKGVGEDDDTTYGTNRTGFTINKNTGKLNSVTINGNLLNISQEFLYYTGVSSGGARSSGAYIFRPEDTTAKPISENLVIQQARGKLVDEFHQTWNEEVTQIIRVYKNETNPHIEFDWLVGDLKYDGKEVITRFTVTNFVNQGNFFTDSNSRQQIKRVKNTRNDYSYDITVEPVASNYYPVTSKIVIKDTNKKKEVAVLNDRAQGGSSLTDGSIELMIHRRLSRDDGFGVNEVLNETQYGKGLYVRGQHYLTFGSTEGNNTAAAIERNLAQKKLLAPWVLVADATVEKLNSTEKVKNLIQFQYEGLKSPLPNNTQILTLEPWIDSYILRVEHIFEKGEDKNLSAPVTSLNLTDMFTQFTINKVTELPLGANQLNQNGNITNWQDVNSKNSPLIFNLNPMEIKTFLIQTNQSNIGGHTDEDGTELDLDGEGNNDSDDDENDSQLLNAASTLILLVTTLCILF